MQKDLVEKQYIWRFFRQHISKTRNNHICNSSNHRWNKCQLNIQPTLMYLHPSWDCNDVHDEGVSHLNFIITIIMMNIIIFNIIMTMMVMIPEPLSRWSRRRRRARSLCLVEPDNYLDHQVDHEEHKHDHHDHCHFEEHEHDHPEEHEHEHDHHDHVHDDQVLCRLMTRLFSLENPQWRSDWTSRVKKGLLVVDNHKNILPEYNF